MLGFQFEKTIYQGLTFIVHGRKIFFRVE